MGGLDFLRRLRDDPFGAVIPTIVATAVTTTMLRAYGRELHSLGAETLTKAFDLDDLLSRAARCQSARGRCADARRPTVATTLAPVSHPI